jgi:2-polyprenyl-3-methyl-5-hydroxy-6-metoxy-1,4-benzoquinol methylase
MENSRCYLCKSQKLKQREGKVRDNDSLKILECTSCGLVFLSSFDHIKDEFYEKSGMYSGKPLDVRNRIKETGWDDERRYRYLQASLKNRSLLDFGCGTGNFLLKAKSEASQVCGVEPETHLHDHFKQMGLTVFRNVSEIPHENKYDIITLFHVLEHLPNPKETLSELSEKLEKQGEIIVEVPNADDALLTIYNNQAFSQFTYWSCHLFLFNAATLPELGRQAGLKINYIKQIQRYTLANHLLWLAKGKPGGHQKWSFLDSHELHTAYEAQLAALGKCDTIIASFTI